MDLDIISMSPGAQRWLHGHGQARLLHVFDAVCNLVNEDGEVLSLVAQGVANGPLSAVVERGGFTDWLTIQSSVLLAPPVLLVGDGIFKFGRATIWEPRPDWAALRGSGHALQAASARILDLLSKHAEAESFAWLVIRDVEAPGGDARVIAKAAAAIQELLPAFAAEDVERMRASARALAGLGSGLTPAGDDFLLGVMHALWATRPEPQALALSLVLAEEAAPRTNSLSAAWLRAAAQGEAGEPWHELFAAIVAGDTEVEARAVLRILPTGHSSGADALGGFAGFILTEAGQ